MKQIAFLLVSLLLCIPAAAKRKPPKRPRILGIAGVTILVPDIPEAHKFYEKLIDPNHSCEYCDNVPPRFLLLPSGQRITLEKVPIPSPTNLLAEVSFVTDDMEGFKKFFKAHKIYFDEVRKKRGGELIRILFQDPEGHHLSITDSYHLGHSEDLNAGLPPSNPANPVRIIHAGIIVKDRAATDQFYKDLLGFRPYWHGGMKDDETNWVAMQVPDGTDWVEYMLRIAPNADKHTLGVMNHIALGVPDIHAIANQIVKAGIQPTESPKIGRDGKWQLNLYDAGDTRVEFMEFTPVQKPCCSEFTGPHPVPQPPAKAPFPQ
ncbi:MAG TPA: VOC family protein [Candidatus Acidoferrum sp.]|nr:VOC family protein [Candidatus Acidoferrum sp.]